MVESPAPRYVQRPAAAPAPVAPVYGEPTYGGARPRASSTPVEGLGWLGMFLGVLGLLMSLVGVTLAIIGIATVGAGNIGSAKMTTIGLVLTSTGVPLTVFGGFLWIGDRLRRPTQYTLVDSRR